MFLQQVLKILQINLKGQITPQLHNKWGMFSIPPQNGEIGKLGENLVKFGKLGENLVKFGKLGEIW